MTRRQRLTSNVGYPKLREHLGAVVAVMKLSMNYHDFLDKMDTDLRLGGSRLADRESDQVQFLDHPRREPFVDQINGEA